LRKKTTVESWKLGILIMPPVRYLPVFISALILSAVFAAAGDLPSSHSGADWKRVTPEAEGFDSGKLASAIAEIRRQQPDTHAIFLVFNGHVILDAAFYPYDGNEPHNVASVTKSVMTTLIAIAADQGKLKLDQPVLSFFPDKSIANRDARKERMTVRHLASMSSGLACIGEHDEPTLHQMNASADWVQFTLDLSMAAEPGSVFSYCSPGMHLLSAILQKATGMTTLEFAERNLFAPLGIEKVRWPADPQGVNHGWGDLFLLPGDAAKIGQLWLNGGVWNGKQIVSRQWVEASSRKEIATRPPWQGDYGYGWWIMTGDEIPQFAASGRGGQRVGVFPTLRAVAVVNGGGVDAGEVFSLIGSTMVSPGTSLAENPSAAKQLGKVLQDMKQPPQRQTVSQLPPIARKISGATYRFDPNPLGWQTMKLDFTGGVTVLAKERTYDEGIMLKGHIEPR
jgi:CubicO group peptidase (beta-lactamase class C family)